MENIKVTVNGSKVTLEIDTNVELGVSSSGKSNIIATTSGNVSLPGVDPSVKFGINIYRPVKK